MAAIDPIVLDVQRIHLRELDAASGAGLPCLIDRLRSLNGNVPVVVDAERQDQLSALAAAVRALRSEKRFLFRSAASLVKALADPGPPPLGCRCSWPAPTEWRW